MIGRHLIQRLRAAHKARSDRKARERFDAGYDYAAGALLRGANPSDIENQIDGAHLFDEENDFEDGMESALDAYLALRPELEPQIFAQIDWPAIAA